MKSKWRLRDNFKIDMCREPRKGRKSILSRWNFKSSLVFEDL